MQKEILILGSTGSIGENTLNVIDQHTEKFKVKTLVANSNIRRLSEQAKKYLPEHIAINNESFYKPLKELMAGFPKINVISGKNAINELLQEQYDVTIAAIMGVACLEPILKVMPNTTILGLANKESIICAGSILMELAKKHHTKIIPIDSEHSAIFQVFEKNNVDKIKRMILTASGGPFLNSSMEAMKLAKPNDAIRHPIWSMGAKISVDSATLMNKGLELIEAHYLFEIEPNKLEAVIHPQALVHGLLEYCDGSILAQLSCPNMQTPISMALAYPERLEITYKKLTWEALSSMQFFTPDESKFRCLKLAKDALMGGQGKCIELNIVNELAVTAFLENKISFLQIPEIIDKVLHTTSNTQIKTIEDVFLTLERSKNKAKEIIMSF